MNILVACECSQVVLKAFLNKGHNVYSCDLQSCYGGLPGRHIKGNCLDYLYPGFFICEDGSFHYVDKWDMLIAHPPCTYFSKAGACRLFPKGKLNLDRFAAGLEMRSLFLQLLYCGIPKICIENPTPMKIWDLPPHSDAIHPYEFGEPYSKLTFLWLRGLPPLMSTLLCEDWSEFVTNVPGSTKNKAKLRSQTFQGIANAMAEQWG